MSVLHITADNFQQHIRHFDASGHQYGRGLVPIPEDVGYSAGPVEFPFAIPARESWPDLIADKERKGESLQDLMDEVGIEIKNQGSTPLCWSFSPTLAFEIIRAIQGEPHERFSPASIAALITNWRYRGGYGTEALTGMSDVGLVPTEFWGETSFDRRLQTPETDAMRVNYRAPKWLKLDTSNEAEIVACVLRGLPVSIGIDKWRHQVTIIGLSMKGREIAYYFANSWGTSYGTNGFATMDVGFMLPGDAVVPLTATA